MIRLSKNSFSGIIMTIKIKEITLGLGQLMLDPNNYRLNTGEDWKKVTDDQIVDCQQETQEKLIKENISDLETSIFENGFLEVDKIVVKELSNLTNPTNLKKYLVIEGNRRTAAFKSLINEYYNKNDESFDEAFPIVLREKYKCINVILVEGSDEEVEDYSQRLMGIRHVSGPRQWGGYQSAKLIHDMSDQGYEQIGTFLGMRPAEAKRRHEAYLAMQQMKSNPKYASRANPNLFSLFSEIVGSNKYFKEDWLGWNEETKEFGKQKNVNRVYDAILPDENGNKEINNPSKLRFFVKCVNIPEVREQIEKNVRLSDIDHDFDVEERIKKIRRFITFTTKEVDRSGTELELFTELKKEISALLNKESNC